MKKSHVVTGAFGYSGKYIARQLIERGHDVRTLTNSTSRNHDFGDGIKVFPFNFDDPEKLYESLRGVSVLYNNYWVRFNHKLFTHADAIKNTITLFNAAKKAGVERIVHVSITNPENDLQLEYFHGKAKLEEKLKNLGVSYAIIRPAVIFGKEDILINNIAWALRRFPAFGIFGKGEYGIQPIYVEDLAKLAVEQGQKRENCIINAIGPESFSYLELVKAIRSTIGVNTHLLHLSPWTCYMAARIISLIVGDTFLTKEEIKGLMGGTLAVNTPPVGTTKLTEWIEYHKHSLGNKYANEVARRKDRKRAYRSN
jgi:nucleoside-diphosphate-sugar epimerase